MLVRDMMTDRVACCTPGSNLDEVAKLMVEHDCGAIPVVADLRSRRLIGIVTDRDIVCRVVARGMDPAKLKAEDCMSSGDLACVAPDADFEECRTVMAKHQVRRVPVVDEHNCICGIVSQADIAQLAPQEEIGGFVKEVSQPA